MVIAAKHVAAPALEQWYSHRSPGRRWPTINSWKSCGFLQTAMRVDDEFPGDALVEVCTDNHPVVESLHSALFDCGQVSGDTPNKRTWTQPISSA
jgi:hypothetical protein